MSHRIQWVTLNDITIPVSSIQSIQSTTERDGGHCFIVQCTNQKVYTVHEYETGWKWLYITYHEGLKEAERGAREYGY